MNKQASTATRAQRESAWRDCLARFASSGKTAEAFCRDEAVSTATFYGWRARLRARDGEPEPASSAAAPFIDGSRADVSFIVGMMVGKFACHQPLYQQHQHLRDAGIETDQCI